MSQSSVAVPIPTQMSDAERAVRIDLAACYRLVALYGWDDLVFTHISARVPGPERHFLINPYGMMFEEITASSLVKLMPTATLWGTPRMPSIPRASPSPRRYTRSARTPAA
jgi:ribulose-5-phosphate 4-epimerase/fuculose-1-phosphate aldolase